MLIDFQDATNASNLNPNQKYAVFYVDGRFANRAAVAARCPHAKLYGITVLGATGPGIFAADSETGDLSVASTLRWVETQIKLGVKLIAVYANENRWLNEGLLAGVQALERKHKVNVRKWLAHYTGKRTLEFPWVDAEQYADPGPVDLNVALAKFFGDAKPAPAVHEWSAEIQLTVPEGSTGVAHFAGTVNLNSGQWHAVGADGSVKWSGPGGGHWRIKGIPRDSGPLGK